MASPSMPISTGRPDRTWKLVSVHSLHPGKRRVRPVEPREVARGLEPCGDDPQGPGVDPAPGPERLPGAQLIAVVGDHDEMGGRVLRPVGPGEPQVEGNGMGTEHAREQLEGRVELVCPVGRGLHDLRVQTHARVVDEDAVSDHAQVDAPLDRHAERVEGSHHVVAVEPEVHGQMVAGARGDTDERDVVCRGGAGHQRLRAVPSGHAEHVRATGHGLLGKPPRVVPRLQDDRIDAPAAGLLRQPEPLDLPPSGLGVHEQDRPDRRLHGDTRRLAALQRRDVPPEAMARRRPGERRQRQHDQHEKHLAVHHRQHDRREDRQQRHRRRDHPPYPGPGDRVRGRADRHDQAGDRHQQPQRVPGEHHHRDRQQGKYCEQCHDRAHPAGRAHRFHL
jgi:hypothetical protein